jgi:ABC-type nitrate/sulfonate/bicarbonate transport system ATPase subunit
MKKESLISMKDISKSFVNHKDTLLVIDSLTLDIYQNDFISIVGPSGCGKSTLVDLILGHKKVNKGCITIKHSNNSKFNHNVAVVWQEDFLVPWKTVYQNLEYPLAIKKIDITERKERISFWLKTIGLSDFSNYYPSKLSQGMKKRLAIASIMVTQPDIIFLDEPFTGLDTDTKRNIQSVLHSIHKDMNLTMVLITHDIQEAVSMSNRIIVLSQSPSRVLFEENINYKDDFYSQFQSDDFYQTVKTLTQKLVDVW